MTGCFVIFCNITYVKNVYIWLCYSVIEVYIFKPFFLNISNDIFFNVLIQMIKRDEMFRFIIFLIRIIVKLLIFY